MMKQKRKAGAMIIISMILIGLSYFFIDVVTQRYLFGIEIISHNEYEHIVSDKELVTFDLSTLSYEGKPIPYDSQTNTLYLAIQDASRLTGKIDTSELINLAVINPELSIETLMQQGNAIALVAYGNNWYAPIDVQLTTLPIIAIDNSELESYDYVEGKDNYLGKLTLYQGNGLLNLYEVNDYSINYHLRGNATRYNNKLSYKVELKNKHGEAENVSLLGMRKDDDWILNGMSYDATYMREALSRDIWNVINPNISLHMQYVELLIDHQYLGIYALQEPLDKKQWKADEEDILIKVDDWLFDRYISQDPNGYNNLILNDEDGKCIIDEFEFKNCMSDNYVDRLYIRNLLRNIASSEDDKYLEYDWNDCVNISVFYNMVMAVDSTYKNARLLAKPMDYGYMIHRAVWDFDYNFTDDIDVDTLLYDAFIPPMYYQDPLFATQCQQVYQRVSERLYNTDTLVNLIHMYRNILVDSGAFSRDYAKWDNQLERWDNTEGLEAIQALENIVMNRVNWLDNYYRVGE